MQKTHFILILTLAAFRLFAQPALPATNQTFAPIANPYSGSWIYYTTDSISGLGYLNGASIPYVLAASNSLVTYVNAATNGFVTAGITNGLATTNYVNGITNGLATTNFVLGQNFVTASVTNGLATTNFILSQGYTTATVTNGLATTNFVLSQNYVTSTVTNGLATINYVTNAIATAKSIQATNLASGGSSVGQVLTATSSGSAWSNAPFSACWAGNSANATIAASSTHYAAPDNTFTISATTDASAGTRVPVTRSITLTNLYVIVSAVVTNTDTLTIMTNGVATPITISVTGTSQKTANDTTDSATIAAGTEIGVKIVTASGSAAVKWAWSFEGH